MKKILPKGMIIMKKIFAFIGAGNMAFAIIGGLTNPSSTLSVAPKDIILFDSNKAQYEKFGEGFTVADNIRNAVNASDIIVLAVKPQNYSDVLSEISGTILSGKVIITIAAGISTDYISNALGGCAVVRAMPNTPLLVGKGVTALCRNSMVTDEDFDLIEKIFSANGMTFRLDECDMNKICAVTGSSPAYIFLMIKSICDGARAQGISSDDIYEAVCNMVIGSATLALKSDKTPDELIRMVCSPKGTTEQAMRVFAEEKLEETVIKAMDACTNRANELALK